MYKKKIYITGMTCVSCEMVITDELDSIDEIIEAKVCHKKNQAEITHNKGLKTDDILDKIKNLGYTASFDPIKDVTNERKASAKQWFYSLLVLLILIGGYKIFKFLGLLDWVNIDTDNYGFGLAILIGLIASLSSCLAVVGGVVLSFAAKYQASGNFFQASVKPHLLFHVGRLTSFFVFGGMLGYIGSWFSLSNSLIGWFTVIVAIIMVLLGLNIAGLIPPISRLGVHLPKSTSKVWNKLKMSEHRLAPLLLGAFTFFLPCGFTQSMQLFAIASGSFWRGAFTLFLFALGTLPVLIILGITASRFRNRKMVILQKVVGFVVVLFAFYTLSSGLVLAGINTDIGLNKNYGQTTKQDSQQIVKMDVSYQGYSPNVFTIKKGVPVKWVVNVKQMTGCTNEIMIPSLKISKKLQVGENVVEFTPQQAGDLRFSCWMGMVRGKFIVTDDSANSSQGAVQESVNQSDDTEFASSQCDGSSCEGGCGGGCGASSCQLNQ
ncbi:MAG: sulfite exporter TauE/SafE family protein [bacterium]